MKNREIVFLAPKTPLWREKLRHVFWRPKPETKWQKIFTPWRLLWSVDRFGDWNSIFYPYEFYCIKDRVKTENDMREYYAEERKKRRRRKNEYDEEWEEYINK